MKVMKRKYLSVRNIRKLMSKMDGRVRFYLLGVFKISDLVITYIQNSVAEVI